MYVAAATISYCAIPADVAPVIGKFKSVSDVPPLLTPNERKH